MRCLSTAEAAAILGVSGATIRNWSRAGHLAPASTRPITFAEEDVITLKERIRTNRFNRLRKRANKSASDSIQKPDTRDQAILAGIQALVQQLDSSGVNPQAALYAAALHFLSERGEAAFSGDSEGLRIENVRWRRKPVMNVMQNWHARLNKKKPVPSPTSIAAFLPWNGIDDPLGMLYQGTSSVGKKSRAGAYFTPESIIDSSLDSIDVKPKSFLDPCCGTGRYLVRAAKHFDLDPKFIYGFDADPVAVDMARLNLLLWYSDIEFLPDIRCLDSLGALANGNEDCDTNRLLNSIDAIATNPPWGGAKNTTFHKKISTDIKSGESFSLFLEKSLRLLRPKGALSFLLPESVLKIRAHSDVRRLLLEQASITGITLLGRVFSEVFTHIVRIDLVKNPAPENWTVRIAGPVDTHEAEQRRFSENVNQTFDVAVTPVDRRLLDKIFSVRHQTLAGNAEWALGIVTGDNGRCVLNEPCEGSEVVLRGRDVFKFASREPRCHIVFKPETFQQVAPERFFRAPEKLIYRFVSDCLVFAYDDKATLTLNSANIVIPGLPGMSIKAALAFLNSRVFQYIFTKRFQTRKVLRSDLEMLPFPFLGSEQLRDIEERVEHCMTGEYRPAEELDRIIFKIFGLTESDAAIIEERLQADANRPRF